MRALLLCLTLVACQKTTVSPNPAKAEVPAAAKAGAKKNTYGRVSDGPAVSPAEILAKIDSYAGKVVRVEGTVAAVCQHRGCWMEVAGADGSSIRIKVRDGDVVFPTTATGKHVIAEGTVVKIPADPADDKTSCGGSEGHEQTHASGEPEHEDCSRPKGASARIDGSGAVIFETS